MTIKRTTVSFPTGLIDLAHSHGLNVSAVCTNALRRHVQALEKDETGALSAKTSAPATAPHGRAV